MSAAPRTTHIWRIAFVIFTLIMSVVVVLRAERSSDFRDFWRTALAFRTSGELSSELGVHNYLPVFPILCTPLSLLPLEVAIVLFTWLSIGAFGWTLHRLSQLLPALSNGRPILWIAALLMLPYVVSCATLGAFGLILLMLTVEALVQLKHKRDLSAGLLLGLATLLKLLPGALFVFVLLQGRWKACLAGGGMLLVVGLGLPVALLGYEETVAQHERFYRDAMRGHSASTTIHAEKPVKANYSNNAVPMVLRRLLSPIDGSKRSEHEDGWTVNVVHLAPETIWLVYLGVVLLVASGSLWVARGDLVAGYGTWSGVMLLASPLVWTHYLPLAMLPLTQLVVRADRDKNRVALAALIVWGLCAAALAVPQLRAAGAQILSVFVVWAATILVQSRNETAPLPSQTDTEAR